MKAVVRKSAVTRTVAKQAVLAQQMHFRPANEELILVGQQSLQENTRTVSV